MRKIEKDMLVAVRNRRAWQSGNTSVVPAPDKSKVDIYLHGNHIALVSFGTFGAEIPNRGTFAKWPTRTTTSRLRALGIDACIEDGGSMFRWGAGMKATKEQVRRIRELIKPLDTPANRTRYLAWDFDRAYKVRDLDVRYRWDLLYTGMRISGRVDLEGLDDHHIDTVLRRIVRPLGKEEA